MRQRPSTRFPNEIYEALVARRLQWDALLWQVPALSLTAQAFLMTIAVGPDTSRLARGIASVLSAFVAFATLQLFARSRWSEVADSHLLEAHERATGQVVIHGEMYPRLRDNDPPEGRLVYFFGKWKTYKVWMWLLASFGLTSFGVLLITIFCPSLLEG